MLKLMKMDAEGKAMRGTLYLVNKNRTIHIFEAMDSQETLYYSL
jgi:hypothetical protein